MADQTLTLIEGVKAGLTDLINQGSAAKGNSAGTGDFFLPNDGKTVLVAVCGAAAKLITFVPVTDKYGRTETVNLTFQPTSSKTSIVGPWKPALWNQPGGLLKFQPAGGGLGTDFYMAIRVGNPT